MKRVVDTCKKHNVVVGHPHVEAGNAERIVKEGYRFLMCAPVQSYGHLEPPASIPAGPDPSRHTPSCVGTEGRAASSSLEGEDRPAANQIGDQSGGRDQRVVIG